MRKIFYYQCRRLLCNKLFWGLLAVTLWYSREVLYGHSHPGSVQHRALFPLELWVLPYISSPLPLCSGTVLPLLLHLPSGEAGGGTRQRHPCLPQALFLLPMGGIGGRNRTFDPSHPLDGRSLLRPDVPLGQLWGTPRPSGFCPGPRPSLLFGGGMVSGKPSPRPSLPAHRLAFLMCLSPAAPLARPSRGRFFLTYPLELGVLDPGFSLPPDVLWGRVGLSTLGLLLLFLTRKKRG